MGKIDEAIELLEDIMKDRGVPRNIKTTIEDALNAIKDDKESDSVKISTMINMLDEASNDPNISLYARTKIWDAVSKLEELSK